MLRARSGRSQEADNSVLGEGVGMERLLEPVLDSECGITIQSVSVSGMILVFL